MREATVLAPAKVNLFLHIVGRRKDGYHLLESLFAFADTGDRITVREAETLSFKVTGPFAPICERAGCDGDGNIVMEAARLLAAEAKKPVGAEVILEKNLPLSAGLGGGSSDAAATLKVLQILWKLEVPEKKLFDLALKLGADVPACLLGQPCFVYGIGEDITPLETFTPLNAVLVNPGRPLSTPQVFRTYAGMKKAFAVPLGLDPAANQDMETLLAETNNDLQGAAMTLCRDIQGVLKALKGTEGNLLVRMSGSGATCFGLYGSQEESEVAAAWIAREHPKWWVRSCQLVAEPPFLLSRT